jgi:hypothetical protein
MNTAREIGLSGPCPTLARSDTSPRRWHEALVQSLTAVEWAALAVTGALLSVWLSIPALAQSDSTTFQRGDVLVRHRGDVVIPRNSSSPVSLVGAKLLSGSKVNVSNDTIPELDLVHSIHFQDSIGPAWEAGVDYQRGNRWYMNAVFATDQGSATVRKGLLQRRADVSELLSVSGRSTEVREQPRAIVTGNTSYEMLGVAPRQHVCLAALGKLH